jgi:hypothetical protein
VVGLSKVKQSIEEIKQIEKTKASQNADGGWWQFFN